MDNILLIFMYSFSFQCVSFVDQLPLGQGLGAGIRYFSCSIILPILHIHSFTRERHHIFPAIISPLKSNALNVVTTSRSNRIRWAKHVELVTDYLLTAVGLSPGGSTYLHTNNVEQHK